MKQMKKLLLTQLPPPLEQALAEQLGAFSGLEIVSARKTTPEAAKGMPDLVIMGGSGAALFPGCPVLTLSGAAPKRLGALLRQIGQMLAEPVLYIDDIVLGTCVFKPQEKTLVREGGEEVALTDREVDILAYLARYRGQPVSRDALLKNVWQYQEGLDTHTLETHIYRLRQKIEVSAENPLLLLTVEGGYALPLSETAL